MTTNKLSVKFYIIFIVIFLPVAIWLSNVSLNLLNQLSEKYQFLEWLVSNGIIQGPTVIGFLLLFFYLLDSYIWRIKIINKIFQIPNIAGRYSGELKSSYDQSKIYNIVIEIKQTFSSIRVYLFSPRSKSSSIICNLSKNEFDVWTISYTYRNITRAGGDDSDMKNHDGVAVIDVSDNCLKGYYFNDPRDRSRFGDFDVKFVSKKLLYKYE